MCVWFFCLFLFLPYPWHVEVPWPGQTHPTAVTRASIVHDNTGSLTYCDTRELQDCAKFKLLFLLFIFFKSTFCFCLFYLLSTRVLGPTYYPNPQLSPLLHISSGFMVLVRLLSQFPALVSFYVLSSLYEWPLGVHTTQSGPTVFI